MIDNLNKSILEEYQKDASITYRTLAQKIGEAPSTVFSRIKQMKDSGVIRGIIPLVSSEAVGKPTTAWIKISLDINTDCCDFADKVAKNENVMEVHEIAGEWDILLKVKVKDNLALHDLTKQISHLPGINNMESLIAFKTVKEDPRINL
ncbi:MAG: Lrp/AsnC family transcriptional regulator [Candidatus Lokiarchaeota archaeon]|nr:Lrp/AsnC family transcriptional regulator [Candidatus Lokiarchaeota archaeon]